MRIHAIVQARMGSTRLPGKVMMEVHGRPLIGWLVERLKLAQTIDKVIVAIPECDRDSPLAEYIKGRCSHYIGDEENDLCARFLGAIKKYPCDAFARICGDSPLIDPDIVDLVVNAFVGAGCCFMSNVGLKVYPPGQSVEVCSVANYRDLVRLCAPEDREHGGFPFAYRTIARQSMLVDTQADFERVKMAIERTGGYAGYVECSNALLPS